MHEPTVTALPEIVLRVFDLHTIRVLVGIKIPVARRRVGPLEWFITYRLCPMSMHPWFWLSDSDEKKKLKLWFWKNLFLWEAGNRAVYFLGSVVYNLSFVRRLSFLMNKKKNTKFIICGATSIQKFYGYLHLQLGNGKNLKELMQTNIDKCYMRWMVKQNPRKFFCGDAMREVSESLIPRRFTKNRFRNYCGEGSRRLSHLLSVRYYSPSRFSVREQRAEKWKWF